jgi:HAE1 family hydrophobic/amphiphilic exporter-1
LKLTELSINRPAALTMVIMFFIVLGILGYTRLGSDLFPKTNIPFITIVTTYPGAGAREIETQVVDPIEESVSSIAGIKRVTTTCSGGFALTVLEFYMNTDTEIAVIDVQKAVDAVMYKLPRDIDKPIVQKFNLNARPMMTIAVSGNRPITSLYQIAKDNIKQPLEAISGVGNVTLIGGREREIDVQVDRAKLDGYGLSINQVISRLSLENINLPAGSLKQPENESTIRFLGEYRNLSDLAELRIPHAGGSVPLKEIATIKDSFADPTQYARLNGGRAIGIIIQKQTDANITSTAIAIEEQLESIKKQLPPDIEITIAQNRATFITDSLTDSKRALIEGILMTGLVLIIFLREWRSVVAVMVAIPTSIISTFMMMYFVGFSYNLLSLLGLTVCVGILVDDSIVVLENIHRHRAKGKDPVTAAIDGRNEIGMAAVAITLQDVVVFLPIAFMTGLVSQFFRQFALTVVFATLFSLFVSFTLTPMLSARLGIKTTENDPAANRFRKKLGQLLNIEKVNKIYLQFLKWSLNHRRYVVAFTFVAFVFSAAMIPLGAIGSEFMANPDQSRFSIDLELPPGMSLLHTDETVKQIEERIIALPEVKFCFSTTGKTSDRFTRGPNYAQIDVTLWPKRERKRSVWEVADEVRSWKYDYPGLKLNVTEEGMAGTQEKGAPIQVEVTGQDEGKLDALAAKVQKIVEETPGATDVRTTLKTGQPEIQVSIDRLRAASYGLSAAEIAQAMRASINGDVAAKYREGNKEIDIRVRLDRVNLTSVNDIGDIKINNFAGLAIPLKQVANINLESGPVNISRLNRQRLITISANASHRPLGDVSGDIKNKLADLNIPEGYKIQFYGAQTDMEETFRDLIQVLVLAVIFVYMVLVMLYESFLTPFIRMLSLPCGAIGALLALAITGNTFNMISLVGLVMLDGLAAKNGTLLIDYTNTLMKQGLNLKEAILEASVTRLRPIVMTSATLIGGMLPTALALAEGSEIRKGMAIAIIGGMVTSTFLTPIVIPVAYTLLNDFQQWAKSISNKHLSKMKILFFRNKKITGDIKVGK